MLYKKNSITFSFLLKMAISDSYISVSDKKRNQKKLIFAYFTSTLSLTLVLVFSGLFLLLILNTGYLTRVFSENIQMTLVLKKKGTDAERIQLQKQLDAHPGVKNTHFISETEAAVIMTKELDEDFVKILGYNPLYSSIEVTFNGKYATPENIDTFIKEIHKQEIIDEIFFNKDLLSKSVTVFSKINFILAILTILLLFIAIVLINNTVRMHYFANRFSIYTMQLVGASPVFIIKPYLNRSLLQSVIAAFTAIIVLFVLTLLFQNFLKNIFQIKYFALSAVFISLFSTGVMVATTLKSVFKYIYINIENLYY